MDPLKRLHSGCCGGDTSPINLSLLTMPDKFDVRLDSFWLWEAALIIIFEPFFKPVVGLLEHKYKCLTVQLGKLNSFILYCVLSYLYSFWMFYSYHRAVDDQPYNPKLTENKILVLGYIFLIGGIALKIYSYRKYGVVTIMGGDYFDIAETVQPESSYEPYYHPAGTATLACLFGLTLVRASLAGLLLHAISVVAYHLAFFFERHQKKKLK
ncbi:hypothetical protein Btru_055433 [Bulinus truncatus]|nr:hypothetical protein Btru_055433 [Bulinus truncatus]